VLAALVVLGGVSFGSFWTPAMALLSDEAERRGLAYAYVFAIVNLAWAPGQTLGSSGSGALAHVTSDAVPYLLLTAACLLTFALLWRSRSSS
jgi:MFS family permease